MPGNELVSTGDCRIQVLMITPIPVGTIAVEPGQPERHDVVCYLISVDDARILVNTGMSLDAVEENGDWQPEGTAFPEALKSATGLTTEDVDIIINTHLGIDHSGNNPAFHRPPVYVQGIEYDNAMSGGTIPQHCFDPMTVHYQQLQGDYRITDHVQVIATPGYTAGHQSVLLDQEGELPSLIAGRAIYDRAEYEQYLRQPTPRRGVFNESDYLASAARLQALQPKAVYFSHDTQPWLA